MSTFNENMGLERAQEIVKIVASGRKQWGKHYQADEFGVDEVLDALVLIESTGSDALKEVETTTNRRAGMSQAREAQRTKERDEARAKVKELEERVKELEAELRLPAE